MALSPIFGGACRFTPTCSEYARQVLKDFSLKRASFLIFKRIFSCVPFGPYGYDPSPKNSSKTLSCLKNKNASRRLRLFR